MRVLALDIGRARIGIAVSDAQGRMASPVCVLPAEDVFSQAPSWKRVLQDWEPECLVVGLPFTLAGKEGPQAKQVRNFAQQIATDTGLPLEFIDERLSSAEAKRILHEKGMNEKDMRGKIDMIAASIFLQTWLDERAVRAENEQAQSKVQA